MSLAAEREALWESQHLEWRDPAQVATQWAGAGELDRRLLRGRAAGDWWDLLDDLGVTLLVTREYEHLVMAMTVVSGEPRISYLPLPHPSGIAVDAEREVVHVASTRNPNQVYELGPATGALERADMAPGPVAERPLVPLGSRFYPGCVYLHDLALIGGSLHGNVVGHNAVARLDAGRYERVWWPRSIERDGVPDFSRNYLQLNSIAAGATVEDSYFSASSERPSNRRPGHLNYPVDRRGVIFSGRTREPVARGLTRPHSVRLHRDRLWVANSGYGELCTVADGAPAVAARLPGWTRGLCFHAERDVAFVGTSQVIPRFRRYAPGLDVERSRCGVHAVDVDSGRVIGAYSWPFGNQIFALELVDRSVTHGFPFRDGARSASKRLFYSFDSPAVRGDRL